MSCPCIFFSPPEPYFYSFFYVKQVGKSLQGEVAERNEVVEYIKKKKGVCVCVWGGGSAFVPTILMKLGSRNNMTTSRIITSKKTIPTGHFSSKLNKWIFLTFFPDLNIDIFPFKKNQQHHRLIKKACLFDRIQLRLMADLCPLSKVLFLYTICSSQVTS